MKASNYSFDSYGIFWGSSAILHPALIVLLYADIRHICCTTDVNVQQSAGNVRYVHVVICPYFLYDSRCTCGQFLWCEV